MLAKTTSTILVNSVIKDICLNCKFHKSKRRSFILPHNPFCLFFHNNGSTRCHPYLFLSNPYSFPLQSEPETRFLWTPTLLFVTWGTFPQTGQISCEIYSPRQQFYQMASSSSFSWYGRLTTQPLVCCYGILQKK